MKNIKRFCLNMNKDRSWENFAKIETSQKINMFFEWFSSFTDLILSTNFRCLKKNAKEKNRRSRRLSYNLPINDLFLQLKVWNNI